MSSLKTLYFVYWILTLANDYFHLASQRRLVIATDQRWTINFLRRPHEKLELFWRGATIN